MLDAAILADKENMFYESHLTLDTQKNHRATDKLNVEKQKYDRVSLGCSQLITRRYSTSFSIGILCLDRSIRSAIYQIYAFVRIADEIVDTFHEYDKRALLDEFEAETFKSIDRKISTNPVLQGFQEVVHLYNIDLGLVRSFLHSMRMDLEERTYDTESYKEYIYGSAEVVGLMCLQVFVQGSTTKYHELKPMAMKLGSAFQKINFLRDVKSDSMDLGRMYFPELDLKSFDNTVKNNLIKGIEEEFDEALIGIKKLPDAARWGVYIAYLYYKELTHQIFSSSTDVLLQKRISVTKARKIWILIKVYCMKSLNWNL